MGLTVTPDGVIGALRTTVGTPGAYEAARARIPSNPPMEDGYATNVQTCDLNALNAAFAVLEWKRMRGFYASDRNLLSSVLIVGNGVLHEEERGWTKITSEANPVDRLTAVAALPTNARLILD